MRTNLIASVIVAALLLTGIAVAVSQETVQGAQLRQNAATETTAAAQPTTVATTAPVMLTREEALTVALAHAGVTAEDITALQTENDTHDRLPHWEIEWRVGDWEYDYEIHAQTGAVLAAMKEYDPPRAKPAVTETVPAATEPPAAPAATEPAHTPTQPAPEYLTAEEALAIALKQAQLTEAQITFPKTEFDRDDGVPQWDVEFRCGGWEYDYEIHAQTGVILEQDKDWDD